MPVSGGQDSKAIALFDTGGVAKNPCMVALLSGRLAREIRIPSDPQLAGAYGAVLLAAEQKKNCS